MNNVKRVSGKCLCGKVSVNVADLSDRLGACHCSRCRKWTGGPFLTVDAEGDVEFVGTEFVKAHASSEWADRGFCSECGSHLYYYLKPADKYILSAGLFELDGEITFHEQIFIDEKPSYYCFSNQTKNRTGPEVFAAFSAES